MHQHGAKIINKNMKMEPKIVQNGVREASGSTLESQSAQKWVHFRYSDDLGVHFGRHFQLKINLFRHLFSNDISETIFNGF